MSIPISSETAVIAGGEAIGRTRVRDGGVEDGLQAPVAAKKEEQRTPRFGRRGPLTNVRMLQGAIGNRSNVAYFQNAPKSNIWE